MTSDAVEGSSPPKQTLMVDLRELKRIATTGTNRVAAFLSVGILSSADYEPKTLALAEHSMFRFFPEVVPPRLAREVMNEYRAWLIGNSIRELDQHFSVFLDVAWSQFQWSMLHGHVVESDHTVKQISGQTNVAKKYDKVLKALGDELPDSSMLRSLSAVRNCLSHNFGIVSERYSNTEDQTLSVRWLGLETRIQQGDEYVVMTPVSDTLQAPDPTKEASIVAVFLERQRTFRIGDRIDFTPSDLHEICFFYLRLADQVIQTFTANLRMRGISAGEP